VRSKKKKFLARNSRDGFLEKKKKKKVDQPEGRLAVPVRAVVP
jgi:hypothetical protein